MIEGREIYDAAGNVWIWTLDGYQDKLLGGDNPLQLVPEDSKRVIYGGGWRSLAPYIRSADRTINAMDNRGGALGFRLVRTQ